MLPASSNDGLSGNRFLPLYVHPVRAPRKSVHPLFPISAAMHHKTSAPYNEGQMPEVFPVLPVAYGPAFPVSFPQVLLRYKSGTSIPGTVSPWLPVPPDTVPYNSTLWKALIPEPFPAGSVPSGFCNGFLHSL